MNISLIFRSRNLHFYSIERVFGTVAKRMPTTVDIDYFYVSRSGVDLRNIREIRKYARTRPTDTIYHITGDIHYVVFFLPRRRCVLTIHDCGFIKNGKGFKRWLLKKILLDWPVWYAPVVTVISEKTKAEVVSLTGCDPGKISVIANPVAETIYYRFRTFNNIKPVLLFIGSTPNKNLDRVIEALEGFPCILHIVGMINDLQQQQLNIHTIEYVLEDRLSDTELADRYARADLILFPSLYEGFGLPVVEGFKAGRPVLTSSVSPLKELAEDGAWLVDPYSSESIRLTLGAILRDHEGILKRIIAGFRIAEKYSPQEIASQYYRVYAAIDPIRDNN